MTQDRNLNTNDSTLIYLLIGIIFLIGLGYGGMVLYPEFQTKKSNEELQQRLSLDLLNASTLLDSITILDRESKLIELPPYKDQIPFELKHFILSNYKKLKARQEQIENVKLQNEFDKTAWKRATSTNTISSFEDYLVDFPDGRYKLQARDRIKIIREQESRINIPTPSVMTPRSLNNLTRPSISAPINSIRESTNDIGQNNSSSSIFSASQLASKAGPYIVDCCANYDSNGTTDLLGSRSLPNGKISINMSVNWTSSVTGCEFKVTGELNVNQNGCNPKWIFQNVQKSNLVCVIVPGCRYVCSDKLPSCL